MTACKDSLSGKKAVSATLAGVLAVGMVPAAAFAADQPTDEAEGQGIELQEAKAWDAFNDATPSEVKVGDEVVSDTSSIKIPVDKASDSAVTITKVQPSAAGVKEMTVAQPQTGATMETKLVYMQKMSNGDITIDGAKYASSTATTSAPTNPGDYIVVAMAKSKAVAEWTPANQKMAHVAFTIEAKSLDDAVLSGKVKSTDTKYEKTEFSYDGATKWNELKLAIDGDDTGVTFAVYQKGGAQVELTETVKAGTYTIVAAPTTGDYAGQKYEKDVTVAKMDLSKLGLYIDDVTDGQAPTIDDVKLPDGTAAFAGEQPATETTAKVPAGKYNALKDDLDFKISSPATWINDGRTGEYTYTLAPKSNASATAKANVEGAASMTFNRVDEKATTASFTYGKDTLTNSSAYKFDHSLTKDTTTWKKGDFDLTKIAGSYGTGDDAVDLTSDQFTVTVESKAGTDTEGNDITKPGTYTVTVKVVPSKLGYKVKASTVSFTVEVRDGEVASAGTTFSYKGAVVSSLSGTELTYDGKDYLSRIGVEVKDTKGNVLTAGEDYTVTVKNTDTNKEVTEIVDAGNYTIKVKSNGAYKMDDQTLNVKVNQIAADQVRIAPKTLKTYTTTSGNTAIDNKFLIYTGEAQQLKLQYNTHEKDSEDQNIWAELPTDVYTVTKIEYKATKDTTKFSEAKEIKDAGFYKVTIAKSKEDVAKNYSSVAQISDVTTGGVSCTVQVADKRVFADVTTTDWFYGEVLKAANNGYVKGIAGTDLYAPNAGMTRGDVCVVLLRMAGGDLDYNQDGSVNTNKGYNTPFADVDAHTYYAKAIQWAAQMGIVTGFSADTFAPDQTVTREQFATMLARYAKATGADIAKAADISSYADAGSVSDWAAPFVKWAVEAKVMGQNTNVLAPANEVSRAEVAAMAVRYQPKATTTDLVK